MQFARYWHLASAPAGKRIVRHWGWSDLSVEDAARMGAEKARALAERIGEKGEWPDSYAYGRDERPLREEVISEQRGADGALRLAITRNSYGALVLNSANALFIDIDDAQPAVAAPDLGGLLGRLFGRKPPPAPSPAVPSGPLAAAEAWVRAHPGRGFRAYRTKAGHRLLATHALFDPESDEAEAVMQAVGADPLYVRLCRSQRCFRARLSPKPWRVGLSYTPPRFPCPPELQPARTKWHAKYDAAVRGHAVCRFERTIGSAQVHPELAGVVRLHDEATHALTQEPLA